MRNIMFACCLEQVKAMVRTNHPDLYEAAQLVHDYETIARMSPDTLLRLEAKMAAFPRAPKPYFWRGLHQAALGQHEAAVEDFEQALTAASASGAPQVGVCVLWLGNSSTMRRPNHLALPAAQRMHPHAAACQLVSRSVG